MSIYRHDTHISGIIAKNLESPPIAVVDHNNSGRKASPDELPDLRYCSDIYWSYWVRGSPTSRITESMAHRTSSMTIPYCWPSEHSKKPKRTSSQHGRAIHSMPQWMRVKL